MSRLEIQQAAKQFSGGQTALDNLSLEVADGELLAIVGPSGSGKTTLLRAIAGLETLTSGRILFDGQDVGRRTPKDRNVAMVFQQPALYPHLNVADNLAFPLRMRREPMVDPRDPKDQGDRVRRTAARLKIAELLRRRPATLSGGEAQRVALGRALVRRPNCLLMDEPFTALDAPLRAELRGELRRLLSEEPVTTLFVTHDQQEALALGNRVAVLDRGQLQQLGTPSEIYQRPVNQFVAAFVGWPTMNMLSGAIVLDEGRCWFVHGRERLALTDWMARQMMPRIGQAAVLGLRPQALQNAPWPMFSAAHSGLQVTVQDHESNGDRQYVQCRTAGGAKLTGLVNSRTAPQKGESVTLYANLAELQFFAADEVGTNISAPACMPG